MSQWIMDRLEINGSKNLGVQVQAVFEDANAFNGKATKNDI